MSVPSLNSFRDSLPKSPSRLEKRGYVCSEEDTTDCVRWVWYKKRRRTFDRSYELEISLRFELCIADALGATYDENCQYFLNDVELAFIRITRREFEGDDFVEVEEKEEQTRLTIYPRSLKQLENLISFYCPNPRARRERA